MCSLGGDIQAYTRRYELYDLFESTSGDADEAIFCSPAAFEVIDRYFNEVDSLVVPMESAFGGDLDFAQAGTVRGVVRQVESLVATGRPLRRVFLPDSMFWIDDGYDLHGDRYETIVEAFPDLSIELLEVPTDIVRSVVTLEDCVVFFDDRRVE